MLRTEYMFFFGVRSVLGCLFVILDREGLWPVLLRNLTKTTGADNVRKVEAAGRSKGSQWKEQVHCTRPQCLLQCFFEWKWWWLKRYTSKRRDVLGCTSPTTERFLEGRKKSGGQIIGDVHCATQLMCTPFSHHQSIPRDVLSLIYPSGCIGNHIPIIGQ